MSTQDTKLPPLPASPIAGEFASWCRSKGSTAKACDDANTWIRDAFNAGAAIAAQAQQPLPDGQQFCYCGDEISLQGVSGGAAPEGLYGSVTIKVGGEFVRYSKQAQQAQGVPAGRTNSGDETGGTVKRFGWDCSGISPEIIPATNGAFVWYSDYLKLFNQLAAAPQAEPAPKPCLVSGACKHGSWCTETYCQEHCQFVKAEPPPEREPTTWSRYVAGMIACYLKWPDDDERTEAVAGIIERRRWSEPQPDKLAISPLEEQQLFDDWCPYKGNPDPRVVWAAAIDAANGMLAGIGTKGGDKPDPLKFVQLPDGDWDIAAPGPKGGE